VTGGASGLGEATARRRAGAGATVVILDRDEAKGEQVAGEIDGAFALADVTDEGDVSGAVAAATARAPLRTCIHCAGIGWAERTLNRAGEAHSLDTFRKVLEINLVGTPLLGALRAEARDALAQSVLFPKRLGVPDDFASLAMEIVRNGYLNGEVIRMDAGIRMPPK